MVFVSLDIEVDWSLFSLSKHHAQPRLPKCVFIGNTSGHIYIFANTLVVCWRTAREITEFCPLIASLGRGRKRKAAFKGDGMVHVLHLLVEGKGTFKRSSRQNTQSLAVSLTFWCWNINGTRLKCEYRASEVLGDFECQCSNCLLFNTQPNSEV